MAKKNFTQESAASTAAAAARAVEVFATSGKRPAPEPQPQSEGRPQRNRRAPTTQCNFRIDATLREKLADASVVWRMSERDIIELFLRSLPDFNVPREEAPQSVSLPIKAK